MALVSAGPAQPPPESLVPGGNFMHELIGLSPHGLSETVRHSIPSLTRKDPDAGATIAVAHPGTKPDNNHNDNGNHDKNIHPPEPPPAPEPRRLHLLALPPEVLLMILQRLDFAAILRLSKTCKQLHQLATPSQISTLFGPDWLQGQLQDHCRTCLVHDRSRSTFLTPYPRPRPENPYVYPLASRCLDCAVKVRDPRIRVGRKLDLANTHTVWVCRWCGYPIIVDGANVYGCEQMHRLCYKRYNDALFVFFVLGWLQLGLGVVAAALAWRYFRDAVPVLAPTVTNFILMWICLAFLVLRGTWRRTYHYTLFLELTILALWIPPVYYVAGNIIDKHDPVPKTTQATLAMFALNMFFRLIDFLGNIVLLCRFDSTEWARLGIPPWRRPFHYLATALVMWTYPQSLEQKFPPHYL
ncbi:hypothetical protein C8A03DRAFT_32694 [Achaetomium macrosporum]|uniref:F-box domain-containing protein n=1 Tax=Achaetomium macrosporum TaxID=79813 RepID=A0AAN7CBX3_9PEZI|nr:hypothetical protein C8A03DRAFT_32694 [Achaetomium macrosporum]